VISQERERRDWRDTTSGSRPHNTAEAAHGQSTALQKEVGGRAPDGVRRTWAPRGQTPVLRHTLNDWQRVSIAAALAFRWDGRRVRLYFQIRPTLKGAQTRVHAAAW
jgi:hypothetical protein